MVIFMDIEVSDALLLKGEESNGLRMKEANLKKNSGIGRASHLHRGGWV